MSEIVQHTFAVEGMHCASCSLLIDEVLDDLGGVQRSTTSLRKRRTVVDYDPQACSPDAVVAAIAEVGYQAVLTGADS